MKRIALAVALTGIFAGSSQATELTLTAFEPAASDLTVSQLPAQLPKSLPPMVNKNQEPVTFAWKLDESKAVESISTPETSVSKQYWLDVDAASLGLGVKLFTTAPGTLIRVSPMEPGSTDGLQKSALTLTVNGQEFSPESAIAHYADATSMKAVDAGFADGTIAFRLDSKVGFGELILSVPVLAKSDTAYVVHVFEPESNIELGVTPRAYQFSNTGTVSAKVSVSGTGNSGDSFQGYVMSPDGRVQEPLKFSELDGQMIASANISQAAVGDAAGLWQFIVYFRGDKLPVMRDAKAAFALGSGVARFAGQPELSTDKGVTFQLPVESAVTGRLEVRGVLFGTNSNGDLVPAAAAHSAAWQTAGSGTIDLEFAADLLVDVSAPYELRQLELNDQSRMAPIWKQDRAYRIQ